MPDYDPIRLGQVLDELRQGRNESYREASLNAGLDHGALRRYICDGRRPQRQALIALADHFGVNPNELLPLAGYPPMKHAQQQTPDAMSDNNTP
jgi:transcriptional regulator with XRE-family HTH domain